MTVARRCFEMDEFELHVVLESWTAFKETKREINNRWFVQIIKE